MGKGCKRPAARKNRRVAARPNSGVPVQQIKWSSAVIDAARKANGKGGQPKLL